jgi:hypothetical protein
MQPTTILRMNKTVHLSCHNVNATGSVAIKEPFQAHRTHQIPSSEFKAMQSKALLQRAASRPT